MDTALKYYPMIHPEGMKLEQLVSQLKFILDTSQV
jgi:hypothetical protein